MAKASDTINFTVREGNTVYEFENVPFDRIGLVRQQFTQNGNGHYAALDAKLAQTVPNYERFKQSLSGNGKKFLQILRDHPNGINADTLTDKMGFHSGTQLGGMTGGGIKKHVINNHMDITDVYTAEVVFKDGKRTVIYKLGKAGAKLF